VVRCEGEAPLVTFRTDWSDYYDEFEDREPRAMLLDVLDAFGGAGRMAVDLGCGSGIDTLAMLQRGWPVFATDAQQEAVDRLRARVPTDLATRLRTRVTPMEEVELPPSDLVWASFSLFFCDPRRFGEVWGRIREAVRPGGRFAGQLLGERDTWAGRDDISSFSFDEARDLFADGYELERFDEEENDEQDDDADEPKHWHVLHAVARRL
jgi:SAM-dependent methyltransferase